MSIYFRPSLPAAAGSAAAPSIAFIGDPNTGIYSPGGDQVAISTNGTGRLFVDASGNVTVGGATITERRFEVLGEGFLSSSATATNKGTIVIHEAGVAGFTDNGGVEFKTSSFGNGYGARILCLDGGQIAVGIRQNSATWTEKLRLTETGLGLGTSAPGRILDCSSSVNTDAAVRITNASTGTGAIAEFLASNGTSTAWFGIGGTNYTGYGQIRANGAAIYTNSAAGIGFSADNANGYISFGTGASAGEAVRIDNSKRLLVGTSTDSGGALFQVNGDRVRIATAKTPASATDTGTTGEVCWDANYVYVCVATNTWKRSAISTW